MTERQTLRPYYVPPQIIREPSLPNSTSTPPSSSFSFPDIDYSDYIPAETNSIAGNLKSLLDAAFKKYLTTAVGQPFIVAQIILQTRVAQEDDDTPTSHIPDNDSDDEEPNYFSSSAPIIDSPPRGRPRTSRNPSHTSRPQPTHHLAIKNPHSILDTLAALSSTGALNIWKATNTTFLYSILNRTLESFLQNFLAAVIGVTDTEISLSSPSDILATTAPLATIFIATTSAAFSALLLSPIDASRTRLILTPSSQEPRSLLATTRTLPGFVIPHLLPITFLSSAIPTFIATSTPLVIKGQFGLDPVMNPTAWSMFTFLGSALDLAVKFPLETVLRRAQIATWTTPKLQRPESQSQRKAFQTIVEVPQSYRGFMGTMWNIVREEGYSETKADREAALMGKMPRRKRRGQGVEGLYRGWRVGLWGLVGIWGTGFVGGLQGERVESSTAKF